MHFNTVPPPISPISVNGNLSAQNSPKIFHLTHSGHQSGGGVFFFLNKLKKSYCIFSIFGRDGSQLWHSGCLVFIMARGIFSCGMQTFSCNMWDLVPWPGMETWSPALGAWSLSHWTTSEVPETKALAITYGLDELAHYFFADLIFHLPSPKHSTPTTLTTLT